MFIKMIFNFKDIIGYKYFNYYSYQTSFQCIGGNSLNNYGGIRF